MVTWLHEFIWGPGMLVLFLFVGVIYTVKLKGFPVLGIGRWLGNTVGSVVRGTDGAEPGHAPCDAVGGRMPGHAAGGRRGISQFQSACTALAATIGTGNIAGVATALLAGGPGAVFWMWISAFLGMATAYGETELGIRYRKRDRNGGWLSGAMMYLERGLGCKWLAVLYASLCLLASFGMGSMVQANAISETFEFAFSMPPVLIGVVLTMLAGRIIAGGARAIARTAERMVPVSAGIYMAAALGVIFLFREQLPTAFAMIFRDAFSFSGAAGGILGYWVSDSVRYGIARGVFSNEAGLGSMAALNGGADEAAPGSQGQWAIFEVFFDTIVSCTLTAVVILCAVGNELTTFTGNGAELVSQCFVAGLGSLGGYTVSMCVALFAFATIIAWYYMGKQAVMYLGETIGLDLSRVYMVGYLVCVFMGSLGSMETVWEVSDIFNGLMALPNLAALILLVREVQPPE